MNNLTFSIIKPDATKKNITGNINSIIEKKGLKIVAQKRIQLTKKQAKEFYIIHKNKPFYNDLVNYMISGPIIVQVLKGTNAVTKYRKIMGATNPKDAKAGTIRKKYANSIQENAVHGSDSTKNAQKEIKFFFRKKEIFL